MSININTLANDLCFATDQIPTIETVSFAVLVKTGSRDETIANNGISHFLEHMAFKGTKNRTALQIAEEFDMIGGYFNAYTSREKTVYYAQVLKEDVEVAIDIISDILQYSLFDQEEIDREKGVILQEIAQNNDTPDSLIFDLFYETAFSDQAFGRSILGQVDFIKSVNQTDIVSYVEQNYSYKNIYITAAGNLNHQEIQNICQDKFVRFSNNTIRPNAKAEYKGGEIRIEKDLEQVHLILGFPGISYLDDTEYYIIQILSIILGGGMSSRLFQEIREKRGLAYSISSFASSYYDTGIFAIYSGTSDENVNELIDVVGEEIYKICQDIHDDEIKRAKAQVRASLLMSQESSVYRSEKLAANLANFGRYITISEIMQHINSIEKKHLIDFAKKLFSKNQIPTIASIGKVVNLYSYKDIKDKITI
jgi:predicted Zn-dependent peptidase